jgi:GDP-D-mannose 3', 5'-epimerase
VRGIDLKFPEYEPTVANEFEILDMRLWDNCLRFTRGVEDVYALAADMGGMGFISQNHGQILHNNLLINTHILEAARINGVKRYLFTSSGCICPEFKQILTDVSPLKRKTPTPPNLRMPTAGRS